VSLLYLFSTMYHSSLSYLFISYLVYWLVLLSFFACLYQPVFHSLLFVSLSLIRRREDTCIQLPSCTIIIHFTLTRLQSSVLRHRVLGRSLPTLSRNLLSPSSG
jgi:hypothetical protein